MQMCVLQNSKTYGGVGNGVCYEWQEPDGVTWVEGAKPSSIDVSKHEIKRGRGLGRGLGEPLPRKNLKIQTWNSAI